MTQIGQWQRKKVRRLADCRVFTVSESTSISPLSGEEHLFYFIDSADWVNIVPITPDRQVVFVKQFRHGSEQITLEIPGGMIDPGEAPEVAATRECLEESGYSADRVESLCVLNQTQLYFPIGYIPLLPGNVSVSMRSQYVDRADRSCVGAIEELPKC